MGKPLRKSTKKRSIEHTQQRPHGEESGKPDTWGCLTLHRASCVSVMENRRSQARSGALVSEKGEKKRVPEVKRKNGIMTDTQREVLWGEGVGGAVERLQ